jgi:hypothetical protein
MNDESRSLRKAATKDNRRLTGGDWETKFPQIRKLNGFFKPED